MKQVCLFVLATLLLSSCSDPEYHAARAKEEQVSREVSNVFRATCMQNLRNPLKARRAFAGKGFSLLERQGNMSFYGNYEKGIIAVVGSIKQEQRSGTVILDSETISICRIGSPFLKKQSAIATIKQIGDTIFKNINKFISSERHLPYTITVPSEFGKVTWISADRDIVPLEELDSRPAIGVNVYWLTLGRSNRPLPQPKPRR